MAGIPAQECNAYKLLLVGSCIQVVSVTAVLPYKRQHRRTVIEQSDSCMKSDHNVLLCGAHAGYSTIVLLGYLLY